METLTKPQLKPIHVGEQFKSLEVTAEAAAIMPAHYCTSEAVVVVVQGFTESLARELRFNGIKVTCVNPGSINTHFFQE